MISESGIAGPSDIDYLRTTGAHGVLVGEYLMRHANVEDAVNGLLGMLPNGKDRIRHV
ncbi:indole-3-glycerol-phosphate synthase [compost metagenome]